MEKTTIFEERIGQVSPTSKFDDANAPTNSRDYGEPGDPNASPEALRELVTGIFTAEDDPTLSPWTFRTWFLGIGLAIFAAAMTTLSTFKPQPVNLNIIFVVVLSFVLGTACEKIVPRRGWLGRLLNPGPFNSKEHAAITIMAAAGGATPELSRSMSLAAQKLWYNQRPSAIVALCLVLSAQMLGYGVAGLLRSTLVYPTKMLWPACFPTATLLENFHKNKETSASRMRYFYVAFAAMFFWQPFPTYIMPVLGGISIFCLTMGRKSLLITNLFGGVMANEGLGVLSVSLDWSMIAGGSNPLWVPLYTLVNELAGYIISIFIYAGLYYSNHWEAKKYPFLSSMLFSKISSSKKYIPYSVAKILNEHHIVDPKLVAKMGLPDLTASYALALTTINIGIGATITHMLLWHYDDLKKAWSFLSIANLKRAIRPASWNWRFWSTQDKTLTMTREEADKIDPHYALMQSYSDIPNSWFIAVLVTFFSIGMMAIYVGNTTLPWWGFIVALSLSAVCLVFFSALTAMFGFGILAQPFIQMIGAYLIPGKPLANLYFATYGYNSLYMATALLRDLKFGQYVHLAPRCTFTMQMVGSLIGCTVSYFLMESITTSKRQVLTSIQGSNVWSGQYVQSQNTVAIAWGGFAKDLFSAGKKYQWVPFGFLIGFVAPVPLWLLHKVPALKFLKLHYWNTAIIGAMLGALSTGSHSAYLMYFVTGFFTQFYMRRYRHKWFMKYNYILCAGLDGGTNVIAFILTFAVFGGAGVDVNFPKYWGNNHQKNYDYCMSDPGLRFG
ncbi:OPT superfamily oligopeptide transporter [Tothia fuscella]|uniref:OPT superfamily oligopeptide transporter n=1 Tax=Tothia fuscella TaxID=1048955 RepID=A0A9P4NMW9_9PEZI|nr:OPT superfamily oligopeptide transporter [Tothia fuscella]